jgi:hypothetical protein
MARNEWITMLLEQIAELDMALLTATGKELEMLEAIRTDLYAQLEDMRAGRPQLRAA